MPLVSIWRMLWTSIIPRKPMLLTSTVNRPLECSDDGFAFADTSPSRFSQSPRSLSFGVPSRPYLPSKSGHPDCVFTSSAICCATATFNFAPNCSAHRGSRPMSRSLIVAWKHVTANLRSQESYEDEMEFVASNFILVESPTPMPTHPLMVDASLHQTSSER